MLRTSVIEMSLAGKPCTSGRLVERLFEALPVVPYPSKRFMTTIRTPV
jgi:hypothetical protein